MSQAQKDLKRQSASLSSDQHHEMHCRIQNLAGWLLRRFGSKISTRAMLLINRGGTTLDVVVQWR